MANTAKRASARFHFGYLLVLALILTSFLPLSLGLSCAGIFYPAVASSLNVGVGVLSYYISILWLSALVFLPLCGRLLARRDARLCVSGAVLLISLDFVWLANVHSVWQFYIGALFMGIGVAMLLFLAPSTLVNRWFAKKAGFFVGIIMAFTGVGGVVWSAVGGTLINSLGWQQTYMVFAALSAITLPVTFLCLASSPDKKNLARVGEDKAVAADDAASGQSEPSGIEARIAYKSSLFYLLLALAFCLNLGMGLYFLLPSFIAATSAGIANPLLGATAASFAMAGQTISKIALGALGDSKPTLGFSIGIGLGLAGVILFLTGAAAVPFVVLGASFLYGFFYGVTNVMLPIATRRAFGILDYATIYSRVSMAASLGSVVSGFLWGTIVQFTDSFLPVFFGVTVVMIAAWLLVFGLSRHSRKKESTTSES